MTGEELLLAFCRGTTRNKDVKTVIADQGSNFQPLKECLEKTYTHKYQWLKNPAHASWFSGAVERLVAITKQCILRTFHGAALTHSQFFTALKEIKAVVNTRPFTYIMSNNSSIELSTPLSPQCFLQASYTLEENDVIEPNGHSAATRTKKFWNIARNTLDKFWSYWYMEYLQYLPERTPHNHFRQQTVKFLPKVHTIVLVSEKLQKRSKWKLARITELNYSSDNEIRSVNLRMPSGHIITRPVERVYPLELEPWENEEETLDHLPSTIQDADEGVVHTQSTAEDEVISVQLDYDF